MPRKVRIEYRVRADPLGGGTLFPDCCLRTTDYFRMPGRYNSSVIPVKPSPLPPGIPTREQRRRDIRNYGASLIACVLGFVIGYLIRRSGWGGSFGTIIAFFSGVLGLFCSGGLLLSLRR